MRDFSNFYVTEPNKNIEADTNEMVGLILATMILSTALRPALGGDKGGNGGTGFWDFMINYSNNKRADRKEKEEREREAKKSEKAADSDKDTDKKSDNGDDAGKSDSKNNKIFNDLLLLSRKANQKEKDENTKKKNDAMIKLLTACSFDKDGNEIPIEERIEKMKDNMSEEQFKSFKADMLDTYEKCKDDDKFKDALNKEREKITPETYEKAMGEAKKEAKTTLDQLAKEKEEIDEYEKKLDELEKQIENESDKDKKSDLQDELTKLKDNAPQTMVSVATGVSVSGNEATTEPTSEPTSEPKEKDDKGEGEDEGTEEEITDPETGEKKKAVVHTGPRGGKYYYPDGKPKTPEHRVYLEHMSLVNFLIESLR